VYRDIEVETTALLWAKYLFRTL